MKALDGKKIEATQHHAETRDPPSQDPQIKSTNSKNSHRLSEDAHSFDLVARLCGSDQLWISYLLRCIFGVVRLVRRPDGSAGMALVLPALTDCRW